jgi:hypothetical protein
LVSVLGAGLLVGTALAVIIPEGVRSLNVVVTVQSKNIFYNKMDLFLLLCYLINVSLEQGVVFRCVTKSVLQP